VREMFADDVAAGGAEDIADKEDIHWTSLHGSGGVRCGDNAEGLVRLQEAPQQRLGVVAFLHGTERAVSIERAGFGGVGE
jgi:hypothetical protein